jgi:hypothetical protein
MQLETAGGNNKQFSHPGSGTTNNRKHSENQQRKENHELHAKDITEFCINDQESFKKISASHEEGYVRGLLTSVCEKITRNHPISVFKSLKGVGD